VRRLAALLAALALAPALGACGLGAGEGTEEVSLVVTRDFGASTLGSASAKDTAGGETVMRFLQRRFDVRTRFGGGFVQAIEGVSGGREDGRPVDWFYYVNGIEADEGAAATRLHAGDRVWWDRHDWGAAMGVPAVVGSFPEPFRSGADGKRLPTQVACTDDAGAACDEVKRRLADAGVKVGSAALGASGGSEILRVLVGPWASLREDGVARRIERGPAVSGVFARLDSQARQITVLDARGTVAARLGPRSGLLAATRLREQRPTWVVTGTDDAGALAAARALDERALRNRFALAIGGGQAVSVPAPGGRS
jgi:Domain of unknown function (DUF4430)